MIWSRPNFLSRWHADRWLAHVLVVPAAGAALILFLVLAFLLREAAPLLNSRESLGFLIDSSWYPLEGQFGMLPMVVASLAVAVGGWAPLAWWPLLIISYGALFALIHSGTHPRTAGVVGLLFGLGLHGVGHGWFYSTLTTHVAMGSVAASLTFAFLFLGLALFTALPCAVYALLASSGPSGLRSPFAQVSLFASLLTLGEYLRGIVFVGFTSLSIGYGFIDTWLAGFVPVVGLYGIGWLAIFVACLAASAVMSSRLKPTTFIGAAVAIVWFTGFALQRHAWTVPFGKPLSFSLVQPGTQQDSKFDPAHKDRITRQIIDLMTANPADIVVAPETAFPMYLHELPSGDLAKLQTFADQSSSHVLFGIATTGKNAQGHNSMVHMTPTQRTLTQFDKIHLVPFGEYSPPELAWITAGLGVPMTDLSPGEPTQAPFVVERHGSTYRIGTLICHEDMMGGDARHWAPNANLLINPSNLAWFDGSIAIAQRLQIARMRALETGRPMLRIANTGVTALIDAAGTVAQQLPIGDAGVLHGKLTPTMGLTPYSRLGDGASLWGCLLVLGTMMIKGRKGSPSRNSHT